MKNEATRKRELPGGRPGRCGVGQNGTKAFGWGGFVKVFEHEGGMFEVGAGIRQLILPISLSPGPSAPGYLSTKSRFLRSGRSASPGGPGYLCHLAGPLPR